MAFKRTQLENKPSQNLFFAIIGFHGRYDIASALLDIGLLLFYNQDVKGN